MALHPALCMHASKQASKQPASSIQHLDPPRGGLIITEAMKKRQSREARRNIETPRNIHPQSSRQPQVTVVTEASCSGSPTTSFQDFKVGRLGGWEFHGDMSESTRPSSSHAAGQSGCHAVSRVKPTLSTHDAYSGGYWTMFDQL
ncbi:uncharacterized protein TERG_12201 [Trichophyton rubrum CBS 118892]|uniref:Uncharacterized protein n=1 Tax=Trichophyton rubrum (strain ATCC MYA-4607 / CBS 118892) TaxID=559305 RepID=A0A080WGZ9_TRIRC|nr:uncharacterized protein TERG_12201 [Trichophyton rubrum CBS 118892]KFL61766.1 hypothetical protein TERG_12201 [Trichophyton rubrum CBS 118892]